MHSIYFADCPPEFDFYRTFFPGLLQTIGHLGLIYGKCPRNSTGSFPLLKPSPQLGQFLWVPRVALLEGFNCIYKSPKLTCNVSMSYKAAYYCNMATLCYKGPIFPLNMNWFQIPLLPIFLLWRHLTVKQRCYKVYTSINKEFHFFQICMIEMQHC